MRLFLALLPRATSRVVSPLNLTLLSLCFMFVISTANADVIILRQSVEFSYTWGNRFLDFIRGSTPLPNDIDIRNLWKSNWFSVDPYNHFKDFFYAAKGYLICLILGALFITLLLPIGIIFCCCRCCGRCGGRARAMDSRHAKCKRVFFTITLLVLNTAILLCVVLALINNQLLHETFTNKNGKINSLTQMQNHSESMSKYLKTVLEKLKAPAETSDYKPKMEAAINSFIDIFCEEFQNSDVGSNLMRHADYLANSVQFTNDLSLKLEDYRAQCTVVENSYGKALLEAQKFLNNCPAEHTTLCNELQKPPNKPTAQITPKTIDDAKKFEESSKTLSDQLKEFADLSTIIRNIATTAKNQRKQQISEEADNLASATSVSTVVDTVRGFVQSADSGFQNINEVLTGRKRNPMEREDDKNAAEMIGEWDSYRMYGFVAMCCFILLVVIFYYLGICFGICGERPFEDASVCNSGVGANLLMAGVGFTFSFAYILMLVVTCLFVNGGLIQTELCRHVTTPNASTAELQRVDHLLTVIASQMQLVKEGQSKSVNTMWHMLENVSIMAPLLNGCTHNQMSNIDFLKATSLLSVVKPAVSYNATYFLSLVDSNYSAYREKIGNLQNKVPQLTSVVSQSVIDDVAVYSNMRTAHVYTFLEKISKVHQQSDITTAQSHLLNLEPVAKNLNISLNGLKDVHPAFQGLMLWLTQAQSLVNNSSPQVTKSATMSLGRLRMKVVEVMLKELLGDSSCHALGVTAQASFDTLCVNTLRPLNGFWYGVGVCLWLMLPALIFAVKLAGLYRKTEKYSSDYEEPDYMSYQGFYITPGENIPLERKSRGNNSQSGARGPPGKDLNRGNPNYHQLPVYSYDAYD